MKKSLILSFVLIATVALSSMAFAVELSADMVNKFGGQVKYSRIYIKNNKFRMESKEGETITIARQDLKKAWLVMTKQKAYIEMKPDASKLPEEKVKGEVGRRFIGNETIDGHPSKKYEISYKNEKTTLKSYQWIATDINFPVKTAALDGSWSMEYKNIKIGSQTDSLFELPIGYRKMTMPSMPGTGKGMIPGKN